MKESALQRLALANYLIPLLEDYFKTCRKEEEDETITALLDAVRMKHEAEVTLQASQGSWSHSNCGGMPLTLEM